MAVWDNSMPTDFTDGNLVDEGDLDPIVNNLAFVRYATVFQSGLRRTTDLGSITTTEVAVLQTPSVSFENGYLYKVEGAFKYESTAVGDVVELRIHEGAGLAGAVIQSFGTYRTTDAAIGYQAPFSVYVPVTSAIARPYTLGVRRIVGTGTITCKATSWIAILRSGDNTLMTTA